MGPGWTLSWQSHFSSFTFHLSADVWMSTTLPHLYVCTSRSQLSFLSGGFCSALCLLWATIWLNCMNVLDVGLVFTWMCGRKNWLGVVQETRFFLLSLGLGRTLGPCPAREHTVGCHVMLRPIPHHLCLLNKIRLFLFSVFALPTSRMAT